MRDARDFLTFCGAWDYRRRIWLAAIPAEWGVGASEEIGRARLPRSFGSSEAKAQIVLNRCGTS